MKRGQVTVFIVIGLIVLITVGIILYLTYSADVDIEAEKVEHFSVSVMKVKPYVENCIKQQAMVAVMQAVSETEEKKLPPIEEMEGIISSHLDENVHLCANFDVFEEFNIIPGNVSSTVRIQKEGFVAEIDWPLKIKQKDLTISEDHFQVQVPVRLNELYLKVSDITEHGMTLDVDYLLDQELNIEVVGCSDGRIRYVVNDRDYMVGNSILQFFFNTKIENLAGIFEFRNGIKYLVPAEPGKVVMRQPGGNKRLMFDMLDNGYIEGCYEKDNRTGHYNFALVENNRVPATISTTAARRIDIERISVNKTAGQHDFTDVFELSTDFGFAGGTVYLDVSDAYDPILLFFDGTEWGIIDSRREGNYIAADVDRLGKYAVANRICVEEERNRFNILFVPVDYTNLSEFAVHAQKHADAIFSVPGLSELEGDISINRISRKNDLSCLSWDSLRCIPSAIKREGSYCGKYDYYIALIDNPEVGLDHRTRDDVSYIGSYLSEDRNFCNECYTAYEFGKYLGLEPRNVTARTKIGIPLMAVPNFDPREVSLPDLYLVKDEKDLVQNISSEWEKG